MAYVGSKNSSLELKKFSITVYFFYIHDGSLYKLIYSICYLRAAMLRKLCPLYFPSKLINAILGFYEGTEFSNLNIWAVVRLAYLVTFYTSIFKKEVMGIRRGCTNVFKYLIFGCAISKTVLILELIISNISRCTSTTN